MVASWAAWDRDDSAAEQLQDEDTAPLDNALRALEALQTREPRAWPRQCLAGIQLLRSGQTDQPLVVAWFDDERDSDGKVTTDWADRKNDDASCLVLPCKWGALEVTAKKVPKKAKANAAKANTTGAAAAAGVSVARPPAADRRRWRVVRTRVRVTKPRDVIEAPRVENTPLSLVVLPTRSSHRRFCEWVLRPLLQSDDLADLTRHGPPGVNLSRSLTHSPTPPRTSTLPPTPPTPPTPSTLTHPSPS